MPKNKQDQLYTNVQTDPFHLTSENVIIYEFMSLLTTEVYKSQSLTSSQS